MSEREFARVLLEWFEDHKRLLPWRETRDPYRIWLSEIILQQTRVAQGLSYYNDFTTAFPTVRALARATEEQVLRLWQGLGYYSRARNLHKCARKVVDELGGEFPGTFDKLRELPGIGPYTAAAIASIAFNECVAVVDGNVFRVMARIFGINTDIASPMARKVFFEHAMMFVPAEQPGDFNQALMEFGALHCTPRNPKCESCPFSKVCIALKSNSVELLPVKRKKAAVRHRHLNYFVFTSGGKVGLKHRSASDIWKGLYDFYLVETEKQVSPVLAARKNQLLKTARISASSEALRIVHQLSHQKLHISFIEVDMLKENLKEFSMVSEPISFYSMKEAEKLPKPVPVKMFLEQMKKGGKGK
jgi:A/G-specific adenine glycosylase